MVYLQPLTKSKDYEKLADDFNSCFISQDISDFEKKLHFLYSNRLSRLYGIVKYMNVLGSKKSNRYCFCDKQSHRDKRLIVFLQSLRILLLHRTAKNGQQQ